MRFTGLRAVAAIVLAAKEMYASARASAQRSCAGSNTSACWCSVVLQHVRRRESRVCAEELADAELPHDLTGASTTLHWVLALLALTLGGTHDSCVLRRQQCQEAEIETILRGDVKEGCRIKGSLLVSKVCACAHGGCLGSDVAGVGVVSDLGSMRVQVAGKIYFAPSKYFRNGYLSPQDLVAATFKVFDTSHTIMTMSFGDPFPVRLLVPRTCMQRLFPLFDGRLTLEITGRAAQDMKNPLDRRQKILHKDARGTFQYFVKVSLYVLFALTQVSSTDALFVLRTPGGTDGVRLPLRQQHCDEPVLRDRALPRAHGDEREGASKYVVRVAVGGANEHSTHMRSVAVVSFSYTFSPIMFRIEEYRKGLLQFLTSVCAIVGGVFTVRVEDVVIIMPRVAQ